MSVYRGINNSHREQGHKEHQRIADTDKNSLGIFSFVFWINAWKESDEKSRSQTNAADHQHHSDKCSAGTIPIGLSRHVKMYREGRPQQWVNADKIDQG